ncbi:MAG: hypothetical protein U0Q03_09890 [Acidimicrobiales bacterium]
MNEFDAFDEAVEAALRRRAGEVPSTPLGYTDVQRRIVQRRRRTATWATAAVTLPAVVGLGYLAGRRDTGGTPIGGPVSTAPWEVTTTTYDPTLGPATPMTTVIGEAVPGAAFYRCQGPMVAADEAWDYYGYCEYVWPSDQVEPSFVPQTTTTDVGPTTTTMPPVATTVVAPIEPATLVEQVLVVDASGGSVPMTDVASVLGAPPRYAVVATRTVDETQVMPLGADVGAAFDLLQRFGVGGFDTWTPDLIGVEIPAGVTVVLVIGTSGVVPWTP